MISQERVEYANKLWNKSIDQFDKQYILENIVKDRDVKSSDLSNLATLDIGSIIRQTVLLKRAIKITNNTSKLIMQRDQYNMILDWNDRVFFVEEDHIMIKSDLAVMLCFKKLETEQELGSRLFTNFHVCPKEQYGNLAEYYKTNYHLMPAHQARKKADGWKHEIEQIRNNPPQSHPFTAQEFVSTNYDFICTIYLALSRNKMFYQIFNLEFYKKIMCEPSDLMRFVRRFERKPNQITCCTEAEFLVQAHQIFKKQKIKVLKKILIFNEVNQDAFPLFVGFRKNEIDYVLDLMHNSRS